MESLLELSCASNAWPSRRGHGSSRAELTGLSESWLESPPPSVPPSPLPRDPITSAACVWNILRVVPAQSLSRPGLLHLPFAHSWERLSSLPQSLPRQLPSTSFKGTHFPLLEIIYF